MKQIMCFFYTRMVLPSFGLLFLESCGKEKPQANQPDCWHNTNNTKRLPIEVVPMRDGETIRLLILCSPEGLFNKLCFVSSDGPKAGGKIYMNENWRAINEQPLSGSDAKLALDQVEKLIKEFYGDEEFKRINSNRPAIKNMSQEEMTEYIKVPKLNDELDASFALDLIFEYREYFNLK